MDDNLTGSNPSKHKIRVRYPGPQWTSIYSYRTRKAWRFPGVPRINSPNECRLQKMEDVIDKINLRGMM